MTIRFAVASRNAGLSAQLGNLDGGTIKIYSGSQVATADTAESGTLLATFTLPAGAYAVADGVATFDFDPDLTTTAVAAGAAGWARAERSDGTNVFDGSVGTTSADFIINSAAITSGQVVNLTLGSITDPA